MPEETPADYFPNTFQMPNVFVDEVLQWITGNETKVLLVAVREIMGWKKKRPHRRARISLSRFCLFSKLNRATVIVCLARLTEANIVNPIGDWTNDGQMYELNLGQKGKYNLEYLTANQKRSGNPNPSQARDAKTNRQESRPNAISGGNGGLLNRPPDDGAYLSEYTGTGLLNIPEAVYSIDTTKHKTQKDNSIISFECDVWERAAKKIRLESNKSNFDRWAGKVEPVSFTDGVLTLKVSDTETRDWISNRLLGKIERALGDAAGVPVKLSLVT